MSRSLVGFVLVVLSFLAVVAAFNLALFFVLLPHVNGLRMANAHDSLTEGQQHRWATIFWLTYGSMLVTAGIVPFLVGKAFRSSTEALAYSLLAALVLLGMLSLPVWSFEASCNDLFQGLSC